MPTIRLANHSPVPFRGWKRATVDSPLPGPVACGTEDAPEALVVPGRHLGDPAENLRVVDVFCSLDPGARLELVTDDARPLDYRQPPVPSPAQFGGPLVLETPEEDLELEWVDFEHDDGAAYTAHLRRRFGRMLCIDVYLRQYPEQPWAEAEVLVTASNPAVPDMGEAVPEMRLRFGDALAVQPGRKPTLPLLQPGTYLADGQAKFLPLTFFWPRLVDQPHEWASFAAVSSLGIGAVGIENLWPDGTPPLPTAAEARAWGQQHLGEAIRRLYTWEPNVVGPAIGGTQAGRQEEQMWHGGTEALRLPGNEVVNHLSACKLHAERPCNHLEPGGEPWQYLLHPGVGFWDGRPDNRFSNTMFGKPRALSGNESHGRWGPGTQHFMCRRLGRSYRLTGSPVAGRLHANMLQCYLAMRTTTGSTSGQWSAREWFYEGMLMLEEVPLLDDRHLAQTVLFRAMERFAHVQPHRMRGPDYLHTYKGGEHPGEWVSAWMECAAAWALHKAKDWWDKVELPEGYEQPPVAPITETALRVAKRMLQDSWVWDENTRLWLTRPTWPLEGVMPQPDDEWNAFAMPLCVAVVLEAEPDNEKARSIWQQLQDAGDIRWMPPGVGKAD